MENYKASLDNLGKWITGITSALFLVALISMWISFKQEDSFILMGLSLFLLLIYGFSYAFRTLGYTLEKDTIVVDRPAGSKRIAIAEIKELGQLRRKEIKFLIRTLGVGGLFGYWGQFWSPKTGKMQWYATRRDRLILLIMKSGKKICLTPDEEVQFATSLQQKIEQSN